MFCVKCGAKLEDSANFCTKCGTPCNNGASSGKLSETDSGGIGAGVTSIGASQAASRSGSMSPFRFLAMFISAGLVIFVVYVSLKNLYCGLSGTYITCDYFPVTEIAFREDGGFTADVLGTSVTGKYRKQSINSQTYTLTVKDYVSTGGSPVQDVQSYEFIRHYDLSAEKIDDDMFAVMLVPQPGYIDYVGWTGTVVTFNKTTDDTSFGY